MNCRNNNRDNVFPIVLKSTKEVSIDLSSKVIQPLRCIVNVDELCFVIFGIVPIYTKDM